jgi:hypothetical protein
MALIDLYTSSFRLPRRVCILAPGPGGKAHHGRIPGDAFVIAVNKAVLIPDVKPDLWMINHSDQDWYPAADVRYQGPRLYNHSAAVGARPPPPAGQDHLYYLPPERKLDAQALHLLDDGRIRFGGTIVASALQLAHHFGAREAILCGVDMSGNQYWDGVENPDASTRHMHGEEWLAVPLLNPLIRFLEGRGLRITTLSPTRLDVPLHDADQARAP